MCIKNIFFKAKQMQIKILLEKCKAVNAGLLKQHGSLERLIHLDEGFKFLHALRGSPPYLQSVA